MIMTKWQQEYASALDEIDRKVAAGEMTNGEAFVRREQLAADMKGFAIRPVGQRVLIVIAVVIVAFILLRLAVAIIQG
jgi:hypothetical protein